jgi:hypothetical protein
MKAGHPPLYQLLRANTTTLQLDHRIVQGSDRFNWSLDNWMNA